MQTQTLGVLVFAEGHGLGLARIGLVEETLGGEGEEVNGTSCAPEGSWLRVLRVLTGGPEGLG